MSYISFGVKTVRKNADEREFVYTTRLHLDEPELKQMGWNVGDRLIIDHMKCEIRKAVGWEYGPAISEGLYGSGKAYFQSIEPGIIHQREQKRHCRRVVCDGKKGIVRAGEVDNTLNRNPYFEKQKGKRLTDGRRQTIWKPSKKAQDALYVNRVERGLRGTARDFRHTADIVKFPEVDEK